MFLRSKFCIHIYIYIGWRSCSWSYFLGWSRIIIPNALCEKRWLHGGIFHVHCLFFHHLQSTNTNTKLLSLKTKSLAIAQHYFKGYFTIDLISCIPGFPISVIVAGCLQGQWDAALPFNAAFWNGLHQTGGSWYLLFWCKLCLLSDRIWQCWQLCCMFIMIIGAGVIAGQFAKISKVCKMCGSCNSTVGFDRSFIVC